MNKLYFGDNLEILREMDDERVDLICTDPPFNSGRDYNAFIGDSLAQKKAFTDTWTWDTSAQDARADIEDRAHDSDTYEAIDEGLTIILRIKGYNMRIKNEDDQEPIQLDLIKNTSSKVELRNKSPQPNAFKVSTSHILYFGDNLKVLQSMENCLIDLVYIDPPFSTGKTQSLNGLAYNDKFNNRKSFLEFIKLRLIEIKRILKPEGSLFFHIDQRQSHYCKIMLDEIFGEANFMNEIIWSYDYGGRAKKYWSRKHDNIFWYANNPKNYTFNLEQSDRIPYMAPGLVGEKKAKLGKTPTDVWWHTIVPTNSSERTGYPTQKPLGIIDRIVKVHSNEGDLIMDCFAGSGTVGESAARNNRNSIMVDINKSAIEIIERRMSYYTNLKVIVCPTD